MIKKDLIFGLIILFTITSCKKDNDSESNNNGTGGANYSCSGGQTSVTDIDGNVYDIVSIGTQCWMKENLKVTRFRNGDLLSTGLSSNQWGSTNSPAYAIYDDNLNNNSTYGKLYNWYAVADPRGLCPTGWHVPDVDELRTLIYSLDPMANFASIEVSETAGGPLKSAGTLQQGTGLWEIPNEGATNSSGFTGFPGGFKSYNGNYSSKGFYGAWWSSTLNPSSALGGAYSISLQEDFGNVLLWDDEYLQNGLSIRCIRSSTNSVYMPLDSVRLLDSGSTPITLPSDRIIRVIVTSDNSTNMINSQNLYCQDQTAGIQVRFTGTHSFPLGTQLEINVSGQELSNYRGVLQINNLPLSSATIIVPPTFSIAPRIATLADLNTNYNQWEGQLIKVNNVTLVGATTYAGSLTMNDGTGTLILYTSTTANFSGSSVPTGPVSVTGLLTEYNGTKQIIIRNISDVQ